MSKRPKAGTNPLDDEDFAWMQAPPEEPPTEDPPAESSPPASTNTNTTSQSASPPQKKDSLRRGIQSGYRRHTVIMREDHVQKLDRLVGIERALRDSGQARTKKALVEEAFELLFEREATLLQKFSSEG